MALRLLLLPAAVLNMIALAAATAPSDPREMALGPARLNQHDHNNHARRAVHHHHRKHLSRRRIKNESRREAPAYAARQVQDSREAHRRWSRRLEDGEGELARRAAPSSVPVVCLGTVTAYQQCGGMGWSGDTCCIPGYTCVVSDAYYSQCKPVATTTTTSATTSTSSSASPTPSGCTGAQVAYGQCGGVGYTGDTCCPSGYYCSYSNPYWSQCSPGTPLSSSSTTTSSSSSTTTTKATTTTTTSPAATPTGCSGLQVGYGQCGGIGWTGPTCCTSGWTCAVSDSYYSQCIPAASTSMTPTPSSTSSSSTSTSKTSTSTTSSAPSATPSATCSGMQTGYGQCGGIGWSGATCCPSGWTCGFVNDYYSQCLPGSDPSSTTTSSSKTASSTTTSSTKTSSTTTTTSSTKTSSSTTTSSTTTTTSSRTSSTTTTSSSPTPTSTTLAAALGQCGGLGFAQRACPAGYVCAIINPYYSQCLPAVPSVTYTTTIKSTSTTSSATPSATPSQVCNKASSGSDGCPPYTVSYAGVTLPAGQTFPAGGHVNYQAIPKSQYTPGQTYTKPGAGWTPSGFSGNFDPYNNQPGGIYIGRNFFDFGAAAQAFPGGYCIIWVQVSDYNQHFGEGGQAPICTP